MNKIVFLLSLVGQCSGADWNIHSAEDLYSHYRSASSAQKEVMRNSVTRLSFSHSDIGFEYGVNMTRALLEIFPNVTSLNEDIPTQKLKDASILSGPQDFRWLPQGLTTLKIMFSSCNLLMPFETFPQHLRELDLLCSQMIALDCALLPKKLERFSIYLSPFSACTISELPEALVFLNIGTPGANQLDFSHLKKLETLTSRNRGTNISLHKISLPESVTALDFSADQCLLSIHQLYKLTSLNYEGPSALSFFLPLRSLTALTYNDWLTVVDPQDISGFSLLKTLKIYAVTDSDGFTFLPRTLTDFSVRDPLRKHNPDFTTLPRHLTRLHFGRTVDLKYYHSKSQLEEHFYIDSKQIRVLPASITDLVLEGYEFIFDSALFSPFNLKKLSFRGLLKEKGQKLSLDFFPKSLTFLQMTDISCQEKELIEILPNTLKTLMVGSIVPEGLPLSLTRLDVLELKQTFTNYQAQNLPRSITHLEVGTLKKTNPSVFGGLPRYLKTLILYFGEELSLKEIFPHLPQTLEALSLTKLCSETTRRRGTKEVLLSKKTRTLRDFNNYLDKR